MHKRDIALTCSAAHGTGTVLGDQIELEAVENVYAQHEREHPVYISSSKTIFGHAQASAAFVSVLKMILSMRYRVIPPHHVDFYPKYNSGPLRVPADFVPVDESRKFIGTVSSFGFSKSIVTSARFTLTNRILSWRHCQHCSRGAPAPIC